MRLRSGKIVKMSRQSSKKSSFHHKYISNIEEQSMETTVSGTNTSTTIGVTAPTISQTLVSATIPEMMVPTP